MESDLFAGIQVSDYETAVDWYTKLLGSEPAFIPNEVEAVWGINEHGWLYIEVNPAHAGHSVATVFVNDLDDRVGGIIERGIEPANRETYENGVQKVLFRDPDDNEIGFGGAPVGDDRSPDN